MCKIQVQALWGKSLALAICTLGTAVAIAAHLAAKEAERRAIRRYEQLVGEKYEEKTGDVFAEVRPLVGVWGCLALLLWFIKGVGVLVAGITAIYVILGS